MVNAAPGPAGPVLCVFAKNREFINWTLHHTTSGSAVVSHNLIQSGTNPNIPFGGVNASGIGRLGGHYTFLESSNARAVVEDGPGLGDPNMMFPPYYEKYKAAIAWMLSKTLKVPDAVINAINSVLRLRG